MKHNAPHTIAGSCLCGAVQFKAVNQFSQFHLCHCKQCQKTSGSAHASNLFIAAEQFSWVAGEDHICRYDVPGRAISSVFCRQCGCALPYLSKTGQAMVVPAGALDQMPDLPPQDNIFWSERAGWYDEGLRSRKVALFPQAD